MYLCSCISIIVERSIPKHKKANPETRSLADRLKSNCSYVFELFPLVHIKMISAKFSIAAKPPITINQMFPTSADILKYALGILTFKRTCDLLGKLLSVY